MFLLMVQHYSCVGCLLVKKKKSPQVTFLKLLLIKEGHLSACVTTGPQRVIIIALYTYYVLPTQTHSAGKQGKHTELIYTSCEPRIIFMLSPSSS